MQLSLTHRSLQPQQQPIVEISRRVHAVRVRDQRAGQRAQIKQLMPVRRRASQSRDLKREDKPDVPKPDLRDHVIQPLVPPQYADNDYEILANPTGQKFSDGTIFVCQVGERSAVASEMAVALGVKDVVNFRGGTKAWKDAGLPLETP